MPRAFRGTVAMVAAAALLTTPAFASPPHREESEADPAEAGEAGPSDGEDGDPGGGDTDGDEEDVKGFSGDPVLDIVDRAPERAADKEREQRPIDIAPALDPETLYGGSCSNDSECRAPGQCVEGRCAANALAIGELERKGKGYVVAGGTVLGLGLALGVAGAIVVATASTVDSRDNQDVAPGSFESGYSLLGLGLGGIISGAVVLGLGRGKLRKVEAYDQVAFRPVPSMRLGTRGGQLGVRLRF